MLRDYMGIINASENEGDIRSLTTNRPIASMPIASRYRVVDFMLSNMVNAGLRNIGIFAESKSRSLIDHLGTGKPWDLNRKIDGLYMFNQSLTGLGVNDSKLFKNNMEYIYRSRNDSVILSSSYMICNIDLVQAIDAHEASKADITVIYKTVNNADRLFLNNSLLNFDEDSKLIGVSRNIGISKRANISMEIFIMSKDILIDLLYRNLQSGNEPDFNMTIYSNLKRYNIMGFNFGGYLACINSIHSYYKTNMELLNQKITNELFFKNGTIYTKILDEPPTRYVKGSNVSNCLVADGCVIEGSVKDSLLSRYVVIEKGAEVNNCIILQNCRIGSGAKLSNVIIDKNAEIDRNMELKGSTEFPLVIEKRSIINQMND